MMPRPRTILLFALAGLLLLAGIFEPAAVQPGLVLTFLVAATCAVDLLVSPPLTRIEVERDAPDVMSVGARNAVRLRFRNRGRSPVTVRVHDEPPSPSESTDLPADVPVPPDKEVVHAYHVVPQRRGRRAFGTVFLQQTTRLGLWTLCRAVPLPAAVRVYPDIQAVRGVELLARRNRLAEAGVRMSRLRGRGNEFDRLREYRREDEYRSIDWKATARHQSPISREYVVERNQSLLFLLDCGRSMCNETDGISHFDRALNAAILLSYVALRQGDSVGLLACSNRVERWVPPVRGAGAIQSIVRRTYDLEPRYESADYELMVQSLRQRHRKRSLVVVVTHALDEIHLSTIARRLLHLRNPHLVLGAFLKNVPLAERAGSIPRTDLDAFQIAAAAEMAGALSLQTATLERRGLLVLDCLPEQFSSALVSRYLDVKARHLL